MFAYSSTAARGREGEGEQMRSRQASWLSRQSSREALIAWLFILPSLIGFLAFFAVPAVRGLYISLTDWNLLQAAKFVGLSNYTRLVHDAEFWRALKTTVYYVLLNIPLQTVLALALATLMDRLTQSMFVRGVLILPYMLSNVIVALVWLWLLDPNLGIVNHILGFVGIHKQAFLGSPTQALPTIAGINIWRHVGYTALILFAGLKAIPRDVYESGAIDGASEWRMFWSITLPLVRPVLAFVLVTSVIGSFQIFDTIAVTTKGGPIAATRVIFWYIYEMAFSRFKMGYASAMAMALFLILLVVTVVQWRFMRVDRSDLDRG